MSCWLRHTDSSVEVDSASKALGTREARPRDRDEICGDLLCVWDFAKMSCLESAYPDHLYTLKADLERYGSFNHRSDIDQASAPTAWTIHTAATKTVHLEDS